MDTNKYNFPHVTDQEQHCPCCTDTTVLGGYVRRRAWLISTHMLFTITIIIIIIILLLIIIIIWWRTGGVWGTRWLLRVVVFIFILLVALLWLLLYCKGHGEKLRVQSEKGSRNVFIKASVTFQQLPLDQREELGGLGIVWFIDENWNDERGGNTERLHLWRISAWQTYGWRMQDTYSSHTVYWPPQTLCPSELWGTENRHLHFSLRLSDVSFYSRQLKMTPGIKLF